MNQQHTPADGTPRAPTAIGRDLKSNFAELWESLKDRAVHTFDKLQREDLMALKSFDDLKRLVKDAYAYDDARVDTEIDRFVNEGGAVHHAHKH